jgi:hypothetical protein
VFLFERAETTITLKPKDNGTEATFESQFEIVIGKIRPFIALPDGLELLTREDFL